MRETGGPAAMRRLALPGSFSTVIPAKAGIHLRFDETGVGPMDSRLRGNDVG